MGGLVLAVRNPLGPAGHGDPLTEAPTTAPEERLQAAEAMLGHHFARPALLARALTHSSVLGEAPKPGHARARASNERLEFLGDRVLGLLMAEWLAEYFPTEAEGALGRRLGHLVAAPMLAAIGRENGVAGLLEIAPGEARAGVRARDNAVADALEALLAALYLDSGLAPARALVRRWWAEALAADRAPPKDAKTTLQEWAQAHGMGLPSYALLARDGPPHAPRFRVRVAAGEVNAQGEGHTRRGAEQDAATRLLKGVAP